MSGCGSGNPGGPSNTGLNLQGVVLQGNSSASAQSAGASAQSAGGGRITVTVRDNPSLSTTVSGNGTFTLEGVPATGFTLVFSVNGAALGTISISRIQGATQVKIVVQVTGDGVQLVSLETENENQQENDNGNDSNSDSKTCMIEGGKVGAGIELEGNVDSGNGDNFKLRVNGNRASDLVDVAASGASYKCNGSKKGSTDCKSSLAVGAKVHVRGTLTSCTTTAASVTATEVMVQKQ